MRKTSVGIIFSLMHAVLADYTEKKLDLVSMTNDSARLYNGIKEEKYWVLKNGNSGSILNLKTKNVDHDEWSFEIAFKMPSLKYPEFAGLYFWYTDDPIKHGGFKGANGKFSGVMAGLEFVGKSVDIVISVNHGEADYTGIKPEDSELKDSPDPNIFKNHTDMTLKIISTAKNFKIEIYDKDMALLYDRVRYTSMTEIGTRLSGKYFGLSTDYVSAKHETSFKLKDLALFEREESEKYMADAYHTEVHDIVPRLAHEVPHPEEEIQHTISGIEHLTKYLRVVLGEPQSKPVADNVFYIKKSVNFQSAHILELRDALKSVITVGKKHAMDEEVHRQELLYLVQSIDKKISEKKAAEEPEQKQKGLPVLGLVFIGASLFTSGFLIGRRFAAQKKLVLH